jgi:hypothetical protein
MRKEDFIKLMESCKIPERFDQHLLDHAAEMFAKWGMTAHMDEKEHLFESFGLASKPEDSHLQKKDKAALRCVIKRMMEAKLSRKDAATIIKNFNNIMSQDVKWVEE